MSRRVIIVAADNNYMEHAKALMVNCRRLGQYDGDFILIVPKGTTAPDFQERGIQVLEADITDAFHQKFYIFSKYIQERWDEALYLDCDIIVQQPIAPMFDEISDSHIIADQECFPLRHCFTFWREECDAIRMRNHEPPLNVYPELLDWVWRTFGKRYLQYNTAVLLFKPRDMPENSVDLLNQMEHRIRPINTHVIRGTDQPVINLAFYNKFVPVRNKIVSYWQQADERTRIVHYCGGYAPWIDKEDEGMDAYANPMLERPCNDIYLENLAAFNSTFPKG